MDRTAACFVMVSLISTAACAQDNDDIKELKLRDWAPRSMLVTKTTGVAQPAFPVIDVHNHLGGGKASLSRRASGSICTSLKHWDPAPGT